MRAVRDMVQSFEGQEVPRENADLHNRIRHLLIPLEEVAERLGTRDPVWKSLTTLTVLLRSPGWFLEHERDILRWTQKGEWRALLEKVDNEARHIVARQKALARQQQSLSFLAESISTLIAPIAQGATLQQAIDIFYQLRPVTCSQMERLRHLPQADTIFEIAKIAAQWLNVVGIVHGSRESLVVAVAQFIHKRTVVGYCDEYAQAEIAEG